ncbi:MAG: DUF975 family protein [Pseudomonadales bacterium]|jgi:uncharacterized membrane protein|nr:DUF975 family protein [Pseudomonadales bacterium]
MKSRQQIKALARSAVSAQNGTSILLVLISTVASFAIGMTSGMLDSITMMAFGQGVAYYLVYWIGYFVITGVSYVIMINLLGEFIKVYKRQKADIGELFLGFKTNFLRKVGGMLWMQLWIGLWSLLFIIPGIIKALAYYFTPNVLADCPNVTARQALKVSMKITKGYKGDVFMFILSWIGWMLLSILTCGILWIVYVGPYFYAADAGFYLELKEKALADGKITPEELGMKKPKAKSKKK